MRRRDAVRLTVAFVPALGVGRGTAAPGAGPAFPDELRLYRAALGRLRRAHPVVRRLPETRPFFLLGAGPRRSKLVYSAGALREDDGRVVRQWDVVEERIVPSACGVELLCRDGRRVRVFDGEDALWLDEAGARTALATSSVRLPPFAGPLAPVLRALHHEILVNVTAAGPLPNRIVYRRPWYRDAAMMAMALQRTGNDGLLHDWVRSIRDPFDRNNAGETEADNPGQLLYLVSLLRDRPPVADVLAALARFETAGPTAGGGRMAAGLHVSGRSDFAPHPVYQTKWAKFGRRSLGLPDPYTIPAIADSYSSLFWWAFRDEHVAVPPFSAEDAQHYPYLVWAEDHFTGGALGPVGDRDYPLSWESRASQADYEALRVLAPAFADAKLAGPHTWHAAEMFLLLSDPAAGDRSARRAPGGSTGA